MTDPVVPPFAALSLPPDVERALRSDHAGETGAVYIYRGLLAISRDDDVLAFAREHLVTELRHLEFFDRWLPARLHSRVLPAWRLAGWMLGAVSGLAGRRAVYLTIEAVETFVVTHYQQQIDALGHDQPALRALLIEFQSEEDDHRRDALGRPPAAGERGWPARAWAGLVGAGSSAAVRLACRV